MAQLQFNVAYDGPAVREGSMPLPVLVPALLSLEALVADLAALVHPELPAPTLSVQARRQGSFIVDLLLELRETWPVAEDLYQETVEVLSSDDVDALVKVITIVGLTLRYMKWRRGRQVVEEQTQPDGQTSVLLEDGESSAFPPDVVRAGKDPVIQDDARGVVAPLEQDGIERVTVESIRPTGIVVEEAVIASDDLASFAPGEESPETVLDHRDEVMWLEIKSLSFTRGNKWRFTDGRRGFFASIDDLRFTYEIEEGRPFRKGDKLRCRVHIVQSLKPDGSLHTDYSIREVFEVREGGRQLTFDEDQEPEEGHRA